MMFIDYCSLFTRKLVADVRDGVEGGGRSNQTTGDYKQDKSSTISKWHVPYSVVKH